MESNLENTVSTIRCPKFKTACAKIAAGTLILSLMSAYTAKKIYEPRMVAPGTITKIVSITPNEYSEKPVFVEE